MNERKPRFPLIFAGCFGILVALFSWLLTSPDSPVREYLRHTYDLPNADFSNFVGLLQIVPHILATIVSGNIHGGDEGEFIYWVLVIGQWFIVGLGLSVLFSTFRRRKNDAS